MALTRKMLKGLGLTEEQIDSVIEGHDETVSALKDERDDWRTKAEKAADLEKKVADLEKQIDDAKKGTDWKAEYDKLKADTEAKESLAKVRAAYKKLLQDGHIDPDVIDTIMDATKFDGMKLDKDGALHDADKHAEAIKTRWGKFEVTEGTKPTPTFTPPTGGKVTRSKEEIMAIKDTKERQKAIADNHELFGI